MAVFPDPLQWVGSQPPSDAESSELLSDIDTFKSGGVKKGYAAVDQFVTGHPDSPWTPALEVHLAEYERMHGNYSLAMSHWESVWNKTKASTDPKAQRIAVRALAGWSQLLSSLGRKEQLRGLFDELAALHLPLGTYATTIQETKEGLALMKGQPEMSYRCGSLSLGHLAVALHMNQAIARKLFETNSPDGGFTMAQLIALAKENGMDVAAVHRPAGAPLVVPSIVHWKLNHYAAITEEKDGRYRVDDPTFNGHIWMTEDTIDSESSGDFIVPSNRLPASWTKLDDATASKIYGKGAGNGINDSGDPGPPGCGGTGSDDFPDSTCNPAASNDGMQPAGMPSSPSCCGTPPADTSSPTNSSTSSTTNPGMPQWSVSEPYITLWLQDTPISYHRSDSQWVRLDLSYKSRGDAQSSTVGGFGDKWSCNWFGMLVDSSGSDVLSNHLGGGAVLAYGKNHAPEYQSGASFSTVFVGGSDPPAIVSPAGAESIYGYAVGFLDGTTNYFLTERLDRYGRVLERFNYETVGSLVRLANMVDMDGHTNTLQYTDASFPNLITAVTDCYGRTAYFGYNSSGLLTNLIDPQGLSTYLQYDASENITNMITPYGSTAFQYFDGADTNGYLARSLLITEPTGDHQLYAYRDYFSPDSACNLDNWPNVRMSYHWNRKQYQELSETNFLAMGLTDYQKASVKHWLHGDPSSHTTTVTDTLDSESDPYDDVLQTRTGCIGYSYQGEQVPYVSDGNTDALQRVTGIYKDGAPLVTITRNSLGRPTSYTYYDSYYETPIATYTNVFDASGTILLYQIGPRGELVRGYGYDPVFTNLLTSVTNAAGDVTRYTHDTNTLRVTSIIFPTGLVRTNIYYTSGANAGFLAQQIDLGYSTNSFGYVNGNISVETNELGLVTTFTYDNLNRLVSTAYPDGTTTSNVFVNLDVVATKDRLNHWAYYGYNAVRQMLAATNENGQITTFSYCGCGRPDQITRWDGSVQYATQMSYNEAGLMTNIIYPDQYEINYQYDADDLPQAVTDSDGHELAFEWYQHGVQNQIQRIEPSVGSGEYFLSREFDEYGRITNSIDGNNVDTEFGYDFLDRLTNETIVDPSEINPSSVETFSYNAAGLATQIDPLMHLTSFGRDELGRVLAETNANNEVLQFAYNPANEIVSLTDGKSQTTRWNYDAYGRVTNKVDAAANVLFVYRYDALNRLTNRWSAAKSNTVFGYDAIGNLTSVVYISGATSNIFYEYDALNRLTNMTDGVGNTAFAWSAGNQLIQEDGPWADDSVNYAYNGRLRSGLSVMQPNAAAWVQLYTYDTFMRLSEVESPAGAFTYQYGSDTGDRVQYLYYGNGGIYNTYSYDGFARLTQENAYVPSPPFSSPAFQWQYAYDENSQRTQEVFTIGSSGGPYTFRNYTYDNIGQLKTANGFDHAYDNTSGQYVDTPRLQEQFGYAYDSAWNLSRRTNNALVQTFNVNSLNELTSATRSGTLTVAGTASELKGDVSGSPPGVTNVTVSGTGLTAGPAQIYHEGDWARAGATLADGNNSYTAMGQDTYGRTSTNSVNVNLPATSTFVYDLNGNLRTNNTRIIDYDDENQLIRVTEPGQWKTEFVYDGLMRMRKREEFSWNGSAWSQTNEVRYVYDGQLAIQERDGNDLPLVTYTRGNDLSGRLQGAGGIGGLLARTDNRQMIVGNPLSTTYYFSDANGNINALVYTNGLVAARYDYDPYGKLLTMAGPIAAANKYRFSSKLWNETSKLYYYGFRFYDAELQTWLSRDPIEEKGGWNLYSYVRNRPLNQRDPFGLSTGHENDPPISVSSNGPVQYQGGLFHPSMGGAVCLAGGAAIVAGAFVAPEALSMLFAPNAALAASTAEEAEAAMLAQNQAMEAINAELAEADEALAAEQFGSGENFWDAARDLEDIEQYQAEQQAIQQELQEAYREASARAAAAADNSCGAQ